jgi:hypothetical protein
MKLEVSGLRGAIGAAAERDSLSLAGRRPLVGMCAVAVDNVVREYNIPLLRVQLLECVVNGAGTRWAR